MPSSRSLISNIAQATVIGLWLREHRRRVGLDRYLQSLCRREHGSGSGFAGIMDPAHRLHDPERARRYRAWARERFGVIS
jgi:hypothetical protein